MRYRHILCCFISYIFTIIPSDAFSRDLNPSDKAVVDSILSVSFQHFLNINITENLKTAKQALKKSQEINYGAGKAKSYFYIARALSYVGEYNMSLEYLDRCEKEEYNEGKASINSEAHRIRGQIYMYLGLPSKSLEEFRKGLNCVNKMDEGGVKNRLKSLAYENLSIGYIDIVSYDSAFYYLSKNRDLLHKMDSKEPYIYSNWVNLYTLFGDYYSKTNQYDSASYYFNKSIETTKKSGSPYTSWTYKHWGDMELGRGNPDSALKYYNLSLEDIKRTNLNNELPDLYKQIFQAYTEKKMNDSAKFYQNKAISAENKLLLSKNQAVEKALNLILEEESATHSLFQEKAIRLISVLTIFVIIILAAWAKWRYTHQKELKEEKRMVETLELKLNDKTQDLIELAKLNDSSFITNFKDIFSEFTENIYNRYPYLINSEFWLCSMIFLNFTSKEIAQYSFVEHRSIQIRKSRLRKKLKIDANIDLYVYIRSFA